MTVALGTAAEAFLSRFAAVHARLPGDAAVRAAAAARFRIHGLPTPRDEAWRSTNLRPLASLSFEPALASTSDTVPILDDGFRAVMVDGRFRRDLSVLPGSVRVGSFADAPRFGPLARPEREPIVALNTMFADDGLMLDVDAGVDGGTLRLISVTSDAAGRATACFPRHAIRLGAGARLTVFETMRGRGVYLHSPVSEITVGEGARLVHVRLQDEAPEAFHLATIYADIAAGAAYDAFTLNIGGRVARCEFHARLSGARGEVHLNGAQLLGGERLSDFTSVVAHDAPACASRQTVKTVLDGRARGVFQGRIEVARAAQKTDGYQMNQALLLSPDAEIASKPELRINADDVKCSHGATVGELDANQLFYLRSRGVPAAEARAILVRAFLTEAFDAVSDETIRAALDGAVGAWWERQAA